MPKSSKEIVEMFVTSKSATRPSS